MHECYAFLQRGWRGYADQDVWSLDGYLSRWLPDALRQLQGSGHPNGITGREWDEILGEMEKGFTAAREVIDLDFSDPADIENLAEDAKRGLKMFGK